MSPACGRARREATPPPESARTLQNPLVAAPRPAIARARIEALLDAWLSAQNERRFDDYAALYATRFDGVRRTRNRIVRMDRAGWMADRRRMFARPMQVALEELTVNPSVHTAEIEFTQRWSSGRYSDVGRKRMLLIDDGGGLRISIEEMLAIRRPARLESGLTSPVWLTLDTSEGTFLVIGDANPVDATGPARLASADGPRIALRALAHEAPDEVRRLVGVRVVVEGSCAATITDLAIGAVVVPHFGIEAEWDGTAEGEDEPTTPASSREIADDVFSLAQDRMLVAKLDARCAGGFATREGAHAAYVPGGTVEPAMVEDLIGRFEARPEGALERAEIQAAIDDEAERDPSATGGDSFRERLSVRAWEHGGERYVAIAIRHDTSCGGSEVLNRLYVDRGGALVPLGPEMLEGELALVDVESDGTPEVLIRSGLGTRQILRLDADAPAITVAHVDYQDCLC